MSAPNRGMWEPRFKYDRGSDNPPLRQMDTTAADLEVPAILVQTSAPQPPTGGQANLRFTVPEGWYWELLSLAVQIDIGAAVAAQPVHFSVDDGTNARWAACLFVPLNIGGFSGVVTWARDAGDAVDLTAFVQTQPMPRSVAKGGWNINVAAPTVGNIITLSESTLIARAIAPIDARSRSVFDTAPLD